MLTVLQSLNTPFSCILIIPTKTKHNTLEDIKKENKNDTELIGKWWQNQSEGTFQSKYIPSVELLKTGRVDNKSGQIKAEVWLQAYNQGQQEHNERVTDLISWIYFSTSVMKSRIL